ncbi:hypothetical protein E2F47_01960 [Mycobacterium eburneum]|nr:hypothetical protein [Mycobacterium eburneum]TDH57557.1 hypothetical protein E2F47_01960 [Mycobacterium eburneum]
MSYPAASTPVPSVHRAPGSSLNKPPFTPQQIEAFGVAIMDEFLAQVLLAVANIQVFGQKPFAGLQTWAQQLEQQASNALATANGAQTTANTANTNASSALSQLQSLISGVEGTVITDVTNAINTAKNDATTAATNIENLLTAAGQETASALGSFISGLLGPNSPLNAANIIGTLFPRQIGPVSISALANITPNILEGAADPAPVTANGTQQQQYSPGLIPVSPGQVYNLSAVAEWSGVTGGTDAISLMVAPYLANAVGTLASLGSGAQVDNPAASSTGTTLSGAYTVPASGVDSIRLVTSVNTSATAGTVSFKSASATLQQTLIPQQFVNQLESDLSTVTTDIQNTWNNFVGTVEGDASAVGKTVTDFANSVQSWIDGIRQAVSGTSDTGASAATAAAAVSGLASTVQSLQASVAEVQNAQSTVSNSVTLADAPSTGSVTTSDWGPDWTMRGNGTVDRSATAFQWIDSGNSPRQRWGTYTTATAGDRQRAGYIFASLMESPLAGSSGNCGNALTVRSSADGTTCVYARNYYDHVELGFMSGGTMTVWASASVAPNSGSLWELVAGSDTDEYEFTVLQNGQTVLSYSDATNKQSQMGASYRYGGMGMLSDARYTGESTPGGIKSWRLADDVTLGTPASSIQVRCTGGDQGAPPVGSVSTMQGGYDTVDFQSPDLVWTSSTSEIKATQAGLYTVRISLGVTTAGNMAPVLLLNGATQIYGAFFNVGVSNAVIADTFTLWLNAGDYVQPAIYVVSGSPHVTGTSYRTTFSVVRVPPITAAMAA